MSKSLDVIIDGELIGRLYNDNPLSFTYSEACLNGSLHSPIKNIIPVEFGKISTPNVHAYFENLLPEGDQRLSLENKFHVTSIFGLLEKAAWDSAGSVVLQPTGSIQESPQYKNKTWVEVAEIISGQTPYQEQIKTSISGAQYKILLSIDAVDASPLLPIGSTVTTHILKPDIVRIGQKILASAANETIMMRAAQKCGLETAHVDYISTVKSCLVRRYDRVVTETGVDRINQFDICQLLKISSGVKYEVDGGPSFAQCYEQVKLLSINPIVDCESVLKWLMFNLLIGNNDSHAKNLSILMTSDGYRLAPFYDLMCTTVYPGFSSKFAFCLGGTYAPGEITRTELSLVAESINVSEKYLLKLAQDMSEQINPAIQASIKELEMQFSHQEKIMAERLAKEVAKICKKRITKLLNN